MKIDINANTIRLLLFFMHIKFLRIIKIDIKIINSMNQNIDSKKNIYILKYKKKWCIWEAEKFYKLTANLFVVKPI